MERLQYVDVFRGIAILVMIFFHFIHVLSPVNVYTDFPYYLESLGIFSFPPPPFLFLFVAGMSAYLLVTRRKEQDKTVPEIVQNVVVKYGRYVAISLPFTVLVFGLGTWLAWEEALQGIGLTIIVLSLLYLLVPFNWFTGMGMMTVAAVLQAQRTLLFETVTGILPATTNNIVNEAGMLVWNATFGGYFSVMNLLPFAIGGLFTIRFLHREEQPNRVLIMGIVLTAVSVLLSVAGYSLKFYARDVPLGFFGAGTSMLIYYSIYQVWERYRDVSVFRILASFGRMAFLVYIWSWILVIKGTQIAGLSGVLTHGQAYIASTVITGSIVIVATRYEVYRRTNTPILASLEQRIENRLIGYRNNI